MNQTSQTELPTDYYLVEKILDKKRFGRQIKYLVKWENYPIEQSSWEPLSNLELVKEKIDEFEKELKGRNKVQLICLKKNKKYKEKKVQTSLKKRKYIRKIKIANKPTDTRKIESISFEIPNSDNEDTVEDSFCNQIDNIPIGCLKKDTPVKILYAKPRSDGEILCLVEWKRNVKGFIPDPSYCTASELRVVYHDLVIDFYQSKINFNQL